MRVYVFKDFYHVPWIILIIEKPNSIIDSKYKRYSCDESLLELFARSMDLLKILGFTIMGINLGKSTRRYDFRDTCAASSHEMAYSV
ncbi:hypothetical protein EUGRSUZ_I00170 [Eucalyptus grandis]|uniref:Uncharacterized protein n=2 Tax=Eucalyptus grandis TaxID=71139 RepID=A0ACC3JAV7_EUCGR|nr:hypothetical protein EUGRSUZ_I00170 [Eucalyptus grandis]